jgi:hypothetical protein
VAPISSNQLASCCLHAYVCVLVQLARFGQVITNRVNVWLWNAALNRLSTLSRLRRFRTLLRFYFLCHFRPSKSCLGWRLHATFHLGAYVLIAIAHQAITPRRPAAQSCRCARVYITHQQFWNAGWFCRSLCGHFAEVIGARAARPGNTPSTSLPSLTTAVPFTKTNCIPSEYCRGFS